MSDADFEEILKPEIPLDAASLRRGTDRRIYYVARLEKEPARGHLDEYRKLIASRGFLMFEDPGNPHLVPPRTLSYNFSVFKKGQVQPYTLFYRQFYDLDERWSKENPLRSLPYPFTLEGRDLVLRLPVNALQPWKETVLIPEQDVVAVREFPFPRFPGGILRSVSRRERQSDLVEDAGVGRDYVVLAEDLDEVLRHYEQALRNYGIPIARPWNDQNELRWLNLQTPIKGIKRVTVRRGDFDPIPGSGLGLDQVQSAAPALFAGFPKNAFVIYLVLEFADNETAAIFWPADDQLRRTELLRKRRTKE